MAMVLVRLALFPRWIIETPPDRCHKRKAAVRLEMTGFRVTHTLCTRPLLRPVSYVYSWVDTQKKKKRKKKESVVYPPCLRAFSPASFLSWLRWTLVQATRWEEDKNGGEVRCYEGLCLFYTLSGWGERTRERQVIVQIIISHYHCVTIVHLVHLHRYR